MANHESSGAGAVDKPVTIRLDSNIIYGGQKGQVLSLTTDSSVVFGALPFQTPVIRTELSLFVKAASKEDALLYWTSLKKHLNKQMVFQQSENTRRRRIDYKFNIKEREVLELLEGKQKYLSVVRFHSVARVEKRFLHIPSQTILLTRLKRNYGCVCVQRKQVIMYTNTAVTTPTTLEVGTESQHWLETGDTIIIQTKDVGQIRGKVTATGDRTFTCDCEKKTGSQRGLVLVHAHWQGEELKAFEKSMPQEMSESMKNQREKLIEREQYESRRRLVSRVKDQIQQDHKYLKGRKNVLDKEQKRRKMTEDQFKVVQNYLEVLAKPPSYFKLLRYYSFQTLHSVLKTDTEELCEALVRGANLSICRRNSSEFLVDMVLYRTVYAKSTPYKARIDENVMLWDQVYTDPPLDDDGSACYIARKRCYLALLEQRQKKGNLIFNIKTEVPYNMYLPILPNHEPVLKQVGSKCMFLSDYKIVEAVCEYLLDKEVKTLHNGLPELQSGCLFLYPNNDTKLYVGNRWKVKNSDGRSFIPEEKGKDGTTHSLVVTYTERWSFASFLRKMVNKFPEGIETVYFHFGKHEILSASNLFVNWKWEFGLLEDRKLFKPQETETVEIDAKIVSAKKKVQKVQEFMKQCGKDNQCYVLASNRETKKLLLEDLRAEGPELPEGAVSCILYENEPPRLSRVMSSETEKKWQPHNTIDVSIATIAEISIFGPKRRVYLVGDSWSPANREKAKELAVEELIEVERLNEEQQSNDSSIWNFKLSVKSTEITNDRSSGFFDIFKALYEQRKPVMEAAEALREQQVEDGRIARNKAMAKELAERRKRTAEEAGIGRDDDLF